MSDRLTRLLPYAALTAAAALVVLLAWQKRSLLEDYNELNRRYREVATQLRPGMYVPAFQTTTLSGEPVTVGELPAEGRQVLLVYTTTCPYCRTSLPAWKRLTSVLDTLSSPRAQVYGVSLDSVAATLEYEKKHALPYPTVRFPQEKLVSMYRAGTVPLTLVLDEEGRTVYSRLGELKDPAAIDSVIAAVKLKPQRLQGQPAQPRRRTASR